MEHRGFGSGSVALIVTGHRLLGDALGYALRLRAGFNSIYVVASLGATEAARVLPQATVVLVDEEQLRDCEVAERIALDLRGTPVVVIARNGGAFRPIGRAIPDARLVPSQSAIDDLIHSLRSATGRDRLAFVAGASHETLSPREEETVSLIGAGLSNREIAERLGVSIATVKNHVHHLLTKLHARSRWQAVAYVRERTSPNPNEPKDSLSVRH